jgi:hypothetical protein
MAQNVGWRNFFWLNVAMRGALVVARFFFMPETKWPRGAYKRADDDQGVGAMTVAKDSENIPSKSNHKSEAEDQKVQSHHI